MTHVALAFGLLVLAVACSDKQGGDSGAPLAGPALEHSPPGGPFVAGDSVDLQVLASDADGVDEVVVYHRTMDSDYWENTDLVETDGVYAARIGPMEAPGLEYYFKATDQLSPVSTSFLPAGASTAPYALEVVPTALALPYTEDFEPDGSVDSLFEMDWWTPSEGFSGYAWSLGSSGRESAGAAVHYRGASSVGVLGDWLISPALDLSSVDAAMVSWWEAGANTAAADHRLYISTSSRDPDDGGYVAVDEALAAPGGDWARSAVVDLSAWAGEPVVYLAWFYQGEAADDWWIDDVEVRALAADLTASLGWEPDPVHPGETATLQFELQNLTAAGASGLVATLGLPEGGGTFADDELEVGDLDALGTLRFEASLALDAALADNRPLPLSLSLSDGVDTWDFALELVVGLPSTARLDLSLDTEAVVRIELGVGDPDAPTATVEVSSGTLAAGAHSFETDVTALYPYLPPAAGPLRWYARVDSGATGSVDGFTIEVGGVTHGATVLPALEEGVPADVWLPEPPRPEVVDLSPSSASPGDTGLALRIRLVNSGDDTAGPVTVELSSASEDLRVVSGASQTLTDGVWTGGTILSLEDVVVDVDPGHLDSRDLQLALLIDDGVESWTVTADLAVPWPVLEIVGITIEDSGGDGVLDAGESATLEIAVANTGDADATGVVRGTLGFAATSTATATLTENSGYFGRLPAGSSDDDDGFAVQVVGGAAGDTLDLELTLTDDAHTYVARAQLVLGEPPWLQLSSSEDPYADTVDGYDFDLAQARYRVVDGQVELWVESHTSYDPDGLFLEFWGSGTGSSYAYYRFVVQSGVAKLQGYQSGVGFRTIATPTLEAPDEQSVLLRFATSDLAMTGTTLKLGLAAGWCGPDTYYCDHFPDGWGYPYDSFSSASWFSLSW
jgi:hypothetical protein